MLSERPCVKSAAVWVGEWKGSLEPPTHSLAHPWRNWRSTHTHIHIHTQLAERAATRAPLFPLSPFPPCQRSVEDM